MNLLSDDAQIATQEILHDFLKGSGRDDVLFEEVNNWEPFLGA